MPEPYVLGIDAGGTKTLAAVADLRGNFLGCGLGESGNFDDLGAAAAQKNIAAAVEAACQAAGLPAAGGFTSVFFGGAGVSSEVDRAVVRQMMLNLRLAEPERAGVDHDIRIALAGGLSGRPGLVLITGTGTACYGRNAAGAAWRSGGWGPLISDDGSGYWLGLQAMRAAVMAFDRRGGPTVLFETVLAHLGLDDINEIMHRIYVRGLSRAEMAAMAQLVLHAAGEGDAVAIEIIRQGAEAMAESVLAAARELGLADRGSVCEVALVGGLQNAGEVYIGPLRRAILARLPGAAVRPAEMPPVAGACLLALQHAGITVDESVRAALNETANCLRAAAGG